MRNSGIRIKPKKSLGQHFLHDGNIIRKIVQAINVQPGEILVEIGPGEGALTAALVPKTNRLICYEIDPRAVEALHSRYGDSIELHHTDILKVDLSVLASATGGRLRIAGNLPYYISSEILISLFRHADALTDAVLMLQREVAERLVAPVGTKEYGILSVYTRYFSEAGILFRVSPRSFTPPPNVESAIVHLRFRRSPEPCNRKLFRNVVRATFGQRRKMIRNGLRTLGFGKEILERISFDVSRRAEDLTVDDFLSLCRELEPALEQAHLKFE